MPLTVPSSYFYIAFDKFTVNPLAEDRPGNNLYLCSAKFIRFRNYYEK